MLCAWEAHIRVQIVACKGRLLHLTITIGRFPLRWMILTMGEFFLEKRKYSKSCDANPVQCPVGDGMQTGSSVESCPTAVTPLCMKKGPGTFSPSPVTVPSRRTGGGNEPAPKHVSVSLTSWKLDGLQQVLNGWPWVTYDWSPSVWPARLVRHVTGPNVDNCDRTNTWRKGKKGPSNKCHRRRPKINKMQGEQEDVKYFTGRQTGVEDASKK